MIFVTGDTHGDIERFDDPRLKQLRAGDTLLKQDGVMHGCTCLEDGILIDIFTPMREDFL